MRIRSKTRNFNFIDLEKQQNNPKLIQFETYIYWTSKRNYLNSLYCGNVQRKRRETIGDNCSKLLLYVLILTYKADDLISNYSVADYVATYRLSRMVWGPKFNLIVEYVTMGVIIKLTILQNSERVSPIERLLTAIHEAPPIQLRPYKAALL